MTSIGNSLFQARVGHILPSQFNHKPQLRVARSDYSDLNTQLCTACE